MTAILQIGGNVLTRAQWEAAWRVLTVEMTRDSASPAAAVADELARGPWGPLMDAALDRHDVDVEIVDARFPYTGLRTHVYCSCGVDIDLGEDPTPFAVDDAARTHLTRVGAA